MKKIVFTRHRMIMLAYALVPRGENSIIITVSKAQCLRLYIDKKIPAYLEIRQLFQNIIQTNHFLYIAD